MARDRAFAVEDLVNWMADQRALSDWRLTVKRSDTQEYFFIRRQLDMWRAKNVEKFDLVLYRDFEEKGEFYRGLYQLSLHPTLSFSEAKTMIEKGIESAKFLKNTYFPIPEESRVKGFETTQTSAFAAEVYLNALFDGMEDPEGGINSCEIVFENVTTSIRNSRGVFVSFTSPRIFAEVVLDWKGEREEVELIEYLHAQTVDADSVRKEMSQKRYLVQERAKARPTQSAREHPVVLSREAVGEREEVELIEYLHAQTVDADSVRKEMSQKRYLVQERAKARPTRSAREHPVVLSREAVGEFLSYYAFQTSAESVYQKSSLAQPGCPIQGMNPTGDLLTLTMVPILENNPNSCLYDQEGSFLEPLTVIREGEVRELWGQRRFTFYLGRPATGYYPLMKVGPGTMTREDLRERSAVEVARFSDFQIDPLTGDFAGEIRLGWQNGQPVTGGSLSGNIHKVETSMRFSNETMRIEKGEFPAFIYLENLDISGQ